MKSLKLPENILNTTSSAEALERSEIISFGVGIGGLVKNSFFDLSSIAVYV